MPPGDIITQLVALVSSLQNMTNAAILYDDSFGKSEKKWLSSEDTIYTDLSLFLIDMTNKYKTLLKNRPIRHMFSRIESNINTQLRRLEDMDIVNYFVLAKVERINSVLMAAAQENYFGRKYSWCAVTKVTWDILSNNSRVNLYYIEI